MGFSSSSRSPSLRLPLYTRRRASGCSSTYSAFFALIFSSSSFSSFKRGSGLLPAASCSSRLISSSNSGDISSVQMGIHKAYSYLLYPSLPKQNLASWRVLSCSTNWNGKSTVVAPSSINLPSSAPFFAALCLHHSSVGIQFTEFKTHDMHLLGLASSCPLHERLRQP